MVQEFKVKETVGIYQNRSEPQDTIFRDAKQGINSEDVFNVTRGSEDKIAGADPHGFRNLPGLLDYLRDNFHFSGLVFGLCGYILIATFGSMQSLGQYLGYILFLVVSIVVYLLVTKKITLKYKSQGILITIVIFLSAIIFYQNFHKIMSLYKYIDASIFDKPVPPSNDRALVK